MKYIVMTPPICGVARTECSCKWMSWQMDELMSSEYEQQQLLVTLSVYLSDVGLLLTITSISIKWYAETNQCTNGHLTNMTHSVKSQSRANAF